MRRTDQQRAKFAAVVTIMRASFAGVPEDEITTETRKAVTEVREDALRADRVSSPPERWPRSG